MNKKIYYHQISETVKFHEVDMMSVVNNAVYFNYFEDARIKYLQDLKSEYKLEKILSNGLFFIMAHNEADYFQPALLDDELIIHTRIDFIKNSSFGFKHLVERKNDGEIIAKGGGIVVQINLADKSPVKLDEAFIAAVTDKEDEVTLIK